MPDVAERYAPSAPKTLVLCEPPYVFWDRGMDRLRQGEESIPGMGVLILAAVARQHGYRVHLIDAEQQGASVADVTYFDHLYRTFYSRPDVLCGLLWLLLREPKCIKRFITSAFVYVRSKFAAGRYLIGRLPAQYRLARSVGR